MLSHKRKNDLCIVRIIRRLAPVLMSLCYSSTSFVDTIKIPLQYARYLLLDRILTQHNVIRFYKKFVNIALRRKLLYNKNYKQLAEKHTTSRMLQCRHKLVKIEFDISQYKDELKGQLLQKNRTMRSIFCGDVVTRKKPQKVAKLLFAICTHCFISILLHFLFFPALTWGFIIITILLLLSQSLLQNRRKCMKKHKQ